MVSFTPYAITVRLFAKIPYPQTYYNLGSLDEESYGLKRVCGLWQLRRSVFCGKVCYTGDVLKRVRKRTRKLVWSGD